MFESNALIHQRRIVVISDDENLTKSLVRYKKENTELHNLRLGEMATLHEKYSSDFEGVIFLDTDSRYLAKKFSDLAINWMGIFFPRAKVMMFISDNDAVQAELPVLQTFKANRNSLQQFTSSRLLFINRQIHVSNVTQSLTPQEKNVIGELALGNSIKEIASLSGRSVKTIYAHKAQALKKLNVHKSHVFSYFLSRFGYEQF